MKLATLPKVGVMFMFMFIVEFEFVFDFEIEVAVVGRVGGRLVDDGGGGRGGIGGMGIEDVSSSASTAARAAAAAEACFVSQFRPIFISEMLARILDLGFGVPLVLPSFIGVGTSAEEEVEDEKVMSVALPLESLLIPSS